MPARRMIQFECDMVGCGETIVIEQKGECEAADYRGWMVIPVNGAPFVNLAPYAICPKHPLKERIS